MWNSVTGCCIKMVNQISIRTTALYVSNGVSQKLGGTMATHRNPAPPHQEECPIQVARPQCLRQRPFHKSEEVARSWVKPPPNMTLSKDMMSHPANLPLGTSDHMSPHRSYLPQTLSSLGSCGKDGRKTKSPTASSFTSASTISTDLEAEQFKTSSCNLSRIPTTQCNNMQPATRVQRCSGHESAPSTKEKGAADRPPSPPLSDEELLARSSIDTRQSDHRTKRGEI